MRVVRLFPVLILGLMLGACSLNENIHFPREATTPSGAQVIPPSLKYSMGSIKVYKRDLITPEKPTKSQSEFIANLKSAINDALAKVGLLAAPNEPHTRIDIAACYWRGGPSLGGYWCSKNGIWNLPALLSNAFLQAKEKLTWPSGAFKKSTDTYFGTWAFVDKGIAPGDYASTLVRALIKDNGSAHAVAGEN